MARQFGSILTADLPAALHVQSVIETEWPTLDIRLSQLGGVEGEKYAVMVADFDLRGRSISFDALQTFISAASCAYRMYLMCTKVGK